MKGSADCSPSSIGFAKSPPWEFLGVPTHPPYPLNPLLFLSVSCLLLHPFVVLIKPHHEEPRRSCARALKLLFQGVAGAGAKRGERARVPTRFCCGPAGRETCQSMHGLRGNQLPHETRGQRPWGAVITHLPQLSITAEPETTSPCS